MFLNFAKTVDNFDEKNRKKKTSGNIVVIKN